MSGLGHEVMLVTGDCKRQVEHRTQKMKAQLLALQAVEPNKVLSSNAGAGASKFSAAFANKQLEDPLEKSFNAKICTQLKDKIRAEEQKIVLFAKAEEDLFSKIEDDCIQAIKKLYEDSGFAVVAPGVPD